MKREIEFRGRNIDNGNWVYGSLLSVDKQRICIVYPDGGMLMATDVDPDTIGEFTGMTDKNGVKIFEGDILRVDEPEFISVFGVVRFGEYSTDYTNDIGFFVDWKDNEDDNYSKTYRKDFGYWVKKPYCKVRDNIHDNPELLEV